MKIMVLESDPKEFNIIQQTLGGNRHSLVQIASSEQAWTAVQNSELRFIIANWDTSDIKQSQFITRVRAAKLPYPVYVLLTTGKASDDDVATTHADDLMHKPYRPQDLKNRVAMAERIISLSSNLASAREQLESQAVFLRTLLHTVRLRI